LLIKKGAEEEVFQILDLYAKTYEEFLAVPVIKGKKSEKEKFAGGLYTTTCEVFVQPNGRAIQAATSHCLGTNFAKIFHIEFEDEKGEKAFAWQNSWGLSTRAIGVIIMVHGDNKGLKLPPRVAMIQVVIVPIYKKDNTQLMNDKANEIVKLLSDAGIRVHFDDRINYKPGWKYNHWETKGVPIRLEIGEKDVEKKAVMIVRRDNGKKASVPVEGLADSIKSLLDDIHKSMFEEAKKVRDAHIYKAENFDEFLKGLNGNLVSVPWCEEITCEDSIKQKSGDATKANESDAKFELTGAAKSLCIPLVQPGPITGDHKCFNCGKAAKSWTLFGRSY